MLHGTSLSEKGTERIGQCFRVNKDSRQFAASEHREGEGRQHRQREGGRQEAKPTDCRGTAVVYHEETLQPIRAEGV